MELKSSAKNISYHLIREEYHVFLPSIFTLLLLCLFNKNKKTIILLKRQKYQPRNTRGFIAKKKSHRFNLTVWVITCKFILTYFLVAYNLKKWDSTFLFFNKRGLKNMLRKSVNTLQHQFYTFSKLKTKNFNSFVRFAILLSGYIEVNPEPHSNLCDFCGKRVNQRCLSCIKCNVKIHKKNVIIWGYLLVAFAINVKRLLSTETYRHYRITYHSLREWIKRQIIQ